MSYADDLIADSQGWAQRQQDAFNGAKTAADNAYDRSQDQASQRAQATGNYVGAIASLANVPQHLQDIKALQDRGNLIDASQQGAQGNYAAAIQAAAKTGEPANVTAAGQLSQEQLNYHLGYILRAGRAILGNGTPQDPGIPQQRGDFQGDPNTPRGQAVAHLAAELSSAGMPGDFVQKLVTAPKDDASMARFLRFSTPLLNGEVKNADGSTGQYVSGQLAAEGRPAPTILDSKEGESQTAVNSRTGATIASTQPLPHPLVVTPDTKTGGVNVTNPNAGASGAPTASAPTPQGTTPALGAGAPSRGLRNNNPLNVTSLPSGQQWEGQVSNDGPYATFASPEAGWAAADRNLQAYAKVHGINTISGIVQRWAPAAAGNNPTAYAATVARSLGVDPNVALNLSDPQVRQHVLSAMAAVENGRSVAPLGQALAPASAAQTSGYPGPGQSVQQGGTRIAAPVYNPRTQTFQQTDPDGTVRDVSSNPMGASGQMKYTSDFMSTPQYKDYDQLSRFYDTAQAALHQAGGPADLTLIDMAIKANNPTLGARPNQVDQAVNEIGPLNKWAGQIKALVDNGQKLSPEARQAMVNVVSAARQASWTSLQPLLRKVDHDAARYGVSRADLIPDVSAPGPIAPTSGFGAARTDPNAAPVQLGRDQAQARATYASLPPGARYVAPDGSLRTKR